MGVRILASGSECDTRSQAVLYCSTSEWAFGPVFESTPRASARERAEAFLLWLTTYTPQSDDLNALGRLRWRGDPRELEDHGLERAYWRWVETTRQEVSQ